MFAEFRPLPIRSLPRTTDLLETDQYPGAAVTLDSPALSVMTPRLQLDALYMEDVAQARVGQLVATMQQLGRQHTLVVQVNPDNGHHQLCGLFSTTHMARKLGMPLSFIRLP